MTQQPDYARAEAGMQQAVEHADRAKADWSREAQELCVRALNGCAITHVFTIEQVRCFVEQNYGFAQAPDSRAWGGIAVKLKRAGIIVPTGQFSRDKWASPKQTYTRGAT